MNLTPVEILEWDDGNDKEDDALKILKSIQI